jgi:hypothetical protein
MLDVNERTAEKTGDGRNSFSSERIVNVTKIIERNWE